MTQEETTDELEEALREKQERIDELEQTLKRTQADYQNYKRRTEQQREQQRRRAAKQLIKELLQVLDNLQLALTQASKDEHTDLYNGVELVLGQLTSVLEDHGVERITTDDGFDATRHEALLTAPSDEPQGTILEVLQPGYTLGDDVLRSAKVKVSSGQPQEETDNE